MSALPTWTRRAGRELRRLWRFLREASGDAAYEQYLEHAQEGPQLTRKQFYLDALSRRYSQPNRCC